MQNKDFFNNTLIRKDKNDSTQEADGSFIRKEIAIQF